MDQISEMNCLHAIQTSTVRTIVALMLMVTPTVSVLTVMAAIHSLSLRMRTSRLMSLKCGRLAASELLEIFTYSSMPSKFFFLHHILSPFCICLCDACLLKISYNLYQLVLFYLFILTNPFLYLLLFSLPSCTNLCMRLIYHK